MHAAQDQMVPRPPAGTDNQWAQQQVGCDVSLAEEDGMDATVPPAVEGGGSGTLSAAAQVWWRLRCRVLDAAGQPADTKSHGWQDCRSQKGPR